jgi:hypothetical protein
MITNITFKFGTGPGSPPETTKLTPITVFVGPNNSGKSKVLSEILSHCSGAEISINDVILAKLDFSAPSSEDVEKTIQRYTQPPEPRQPMQQGEILYAVPGHGVSRIDRNWLVGACQDPTRDEFRAYYLAPNTLMLDGPSRIALIDAKPAGDLQSTPLNGLQVLFTDDDKRAEVRRILREAFGFYFVVDPTFLGQLRIRFSSREPVDDMEERGVHAAAVKFHAEALPIEQTSDGVKAFTGMVTEIVAGDPPSSLSTNRRHFCTRPSPSNWARKSPGSVQGRTEVFWSQRTAQTLSWGVYSQALRSTSYG